MITLLVLRRQVDEWKEGSVEFSCTVYYYLSTVGVRHGVRTCIITTIRRSPPRPRPATVWTQEFPLARLPIFFSVLSGLRNIWVSCAVTFSIPPFHWGWDLRQRGLGVGAHTWHTISSHLQPSPTPAARFFPAALTLQRQCATVCLVPRALCLARYAVVESQFQNLDQLS